MKKDEISIHVDNEGELFFKFQSKKMYFYIMLGGTLRNWNKMIKYIEKKTSFNYILNYGVPSDQTNYDPETKMGGIYDYYHFEYDGGSNIFRYEILIGKDRIVRNNFETVVDENFMNVLRDLQKKLQDLKKKGLENPDAEFRYAMKSMNDVYLYVNEYDELYFRVRNGSLILNYLFDVDIKNIPKIIKHFEDKKSFNLEGMTYDSKKNIFSYRTEDDFEEGINFIEIYVDKNFIKILKDL